MSVTELCTHMKVSVHVGENQWSKNVTTCLCWWVFWLRLQRLFTPSSNQSLVSELHDTHTCKLLYTRLLCSVSYLLRQTETVCSGVIIPFIRREILIGSKSFNWLYKKKYNVNKLVTSLDSVSLSPEDQSILGCMQTSVSTKLSVSLFG